MRFLQMASNHKWDMVSVHFIVFAGLFSGEISHTQKLEIKARSNIDYKDYNLSSPVDYFDDFLSHDWGTSRWLKVVSMLVIYNSRAALVASIIAAVLLAPLRLVLGVHPECVADALMMDQRVLAISICHGVHLFFLCFWQRIRSVLLAPQTAFLDKLCIAQSPELADLKAKGILGLAAFLNHSRRLVVTWLLNRGWPRILEIKYRRKRPWECMYSLLIHSMLSYHLWWTHFPFGPWLWLKTVKRRVAALCCLWAVNHSTWGLGCCGFSWLTASVHNPWILLAVSPSQAYHSFVHSFSYSHRLCLKTSL